MKNFLDLIHSFLRLINHIDLSFAHESFLNYQAFVLIV